jgi:hypothetical protein
VVEKQLLADCRADVGGHVPRASARLEALVRLIDTSAWALQPTPRFAFRIGSYSYWCVIKIGRWALIRRINKE